MTTGPTYLVLRADEVAYGDPGPIAPDSTGLSRWSGVERARGALHTGVALCRLEPGGRVPGHVHSFEESCYVLEGEVVLQTPDGAVQLTAGDYGVLPVGVPHSWRSAGTAPAVWVEVAAPAPRERYGHDTLRVPDPPETEPVAVDPRDPRTRSFGSISTDHMDPGRQSQELLARSASMRTALLSAR